MSKNSRAYAMRDTDGPEEQNRRIASRARNEDPLAELARIVGQGGPAAAPRPAEPYAPAGAGGQQFAGGQQPAAGSQPDWVNEIERAFAHLGPRAGQPQPQPRPEQQGAAMPEWLRSPAVPVLPVPPGPGPEVYAREFSQALDGASDAAVAAGGYYAQDAYQLAAGGQDGGYPADAQRAPEWDEGHDTPAASVGGGYGAYADDGRAPEPAEAEYDEQYYADSAYAAPVARRRRGLVIAAVALGLGAVAVAGTLLFRGGGSAVDGEPPVIAADSAPVKVEPETPGGAEIPNTNKAIYEHTNQAPSGEDAVVVDNREQPVDIGQLLTQQAAPEQPAETTTTTTTTARGAADVTLPEAPEPTSPAIVALGEPKRVRTVSVRPDGSILPSGGPAAPQAPAVAAPTIEQLATATPEAASPATPVVSAPSVAEPAASVPAVAAPSVMPVPRPAGVNRPATRAPLQIAPMQISPQAGPAGQQVAATPQEAAPQAAGGGFTVQLAAPGSESEARNLFANLQRQHGELAGYSPNILRAQTGGRTIYRLRVGSFPSRDAATALCVRIQASGGQCFVARN
ncbi:MAG: SPOR domain-containing protein [Pseudochelatococcus sp.]|jgi:hypothetical protein|uniref:SPOR domain-containing protein n=1 Tax=Pseudochelatococcus sp. TaxID=2020869 RepID=UPI003D91E135